MVVEERYSAFVPTLIERLEFVLKRVGDIGVVKRSVKD
jgi:hypothetical protein